MMNKYIWLILAIVAVLLLPFTTYDLSTGEFVWQGGRSIIHYIVIAALALNAFHEYRKRRKKAK